MVVRYFGNKGGLFAAAVAVDLNCRSWAHCRDRTSAGCW
jgi:hypothetical protein